jgi:hypothetical protein
MLQTPLRSALLDRDAQGAQKVYILCVKSLISLRTFVDRGFQLGNRLLFYLVQANRRFQHQQHIEALLADVLHDLRDLLGLGNRFMDGLPQLLNKTTKSLVQRSTPNRHCGRGFTYLTCDGVAEQSESTDW